MTAIEDRLRDLRKTHGLSQRAVANKVGISDTAYQNYEYGKRDIPGDVLQRFANLYSVSADYILGLADRRVVASGFLPVPLPGRVAAGDPIPMTDFEDEREVPARFVHDDPNAFLLRVEGESVNKVIPNGHLALISPKQKEPNEHDLFAVCVNGHDATIKHVKPLANGLALIPDSHDPTYRPQIFDYADSDCEEVTIIGKVIWSCMAY